MGSSVEYLSTHPTMSKRRNHDEDNDENENSQGTGYRSLGMMKKLSVNNSFQNEEIIVDPSILEICQILRNIDTFKGVMATSVIYNERATRLLTQFPDTSNANMLKYTNQLIEIPLNVSDNETDLKLHYYENFPFVREPMSISSDVVYFIENMSSFTHFKKVILKNCKLKIYPESMRLSQDMYGQCSFIVECVIYSADGKTIRTFIDHKVLSSANILFEKENLWNLVFRVIEGDENISFANQKVLISKFGFNLYKCFELMDNIEVGVTVDKEFNVKITNILHNYYTR